MKLTLVLSILSGIFLTSTAQAETCGQLAGVKGTVEVLRKRPGAEDVRYGYKVQRASEPIECDDVVLTGRDSSVKVILANAKLSLGPDSRVEIAAHVGAGSTARVGLINLTYGKIRALVHKQNQKAAQASSEQDSAKSGKAARSGKEPQATFRVKTFSAVVGVRGTDFYTSYEPNSGLTEHATIEGSVDVSQAGTSQRVRVESGQQVAVEITPAALEIAQKDAGEKVEAHLPKLGPDETASAKPLKVVLIQDSVRNEIRMVSAVVRDDADFTHAKAVEALGKPETWVLEREKVPEKMKDIKNEF